MQELHIETRLDFVLSQELLEIRIRELHRELGIVKKSQWRNIVNKINRGDYIRSTIPKKVKEAHELGKFLNELSEVFGKKFKRLHNPDQMVLRLL